MRRAPRSGVAETPPPGRDGFAPGQRREKHRPAHATRQTPETPAPLDWSTTISARGPGRWCRLRTRGRGSLPEVANADDVSMPSHTRHPGLPTRRRRARPRRAMRREGAPHPPPWECETGFRLLAEKSPERHARRPTRRRRSGEERHRQCRQDWQYRQYRQRRQSVQPRHHTPGRQQSIRGGQSTSDIVGKREASLNNRRSSGRFQSQW
jgi:hypothetical protein